MEFQIIKGKHVTGILNVSLYVGQEVTVDSAWGPKLADKVFKITDIRVGNCQTNIEVKIDGYPNYLSSDWLDTIKDYSDL